GSTTVGRALVGGAVARRGAAPAPGAGRAAHVRFLRRSKQPSGCGRPSSVPRADKRSADSCTTAVCCGPEDDGSLLATIAIRLDARCVIRARLVVPRFRKRRANATIQQRSVVPAGTS